MRRKGGIQKYSNVKRIGELIIIRQGINKSMHWEENNQVPGDIAAPRKTSVVMGGLDESGLQYKDIDFLNNLNRSVASLH